MNCGSEHEMVLIEQHQSALYRYCLKLTASSWEADDLVQETCCRVLRSLADGRSHANITALLIRTAKNIWIDQKRRDRRLQELLPEVTALMERHTASTAGQLETEQMIRLLLHVLSPLQMAVFLLRDVLQYKAAEVAAHGQMSEGAVKALLFRARRSIQRVRDPKQLTRYEQGADADPALEDLTRAYVKAFEKADAHALVQLALTYSNPAHSVNAVGEFVVTGTMKQTAAPVMQLQSRWLAA